MYAVPLWLSAATIAGTASLPFFHLGSLDLGPLPIQGFGVIVAAGVLIGASILRRYGEWHGLSDAHIRGLTGWVMLSGFLGAHEFDMLAYNFDKIGETVTTPLPGWWTHYVGFLPEQLFPTHWPLPFRFWEGISSYGGFLGGAIGFTIFVWWRRLTTKLPLGLLADITMTGLLPAFTIGRIGCSVVSDHIGSAVDPSKWYAFLAVDYPRHGPLGNMGHLADLYPGTSEFIRAWNLGLIEFLYLVPINVLVLYLAFRASKRMPAGFLTVLVGLLYAPVRFFLDFLRPEDTDPRYVGLTFAQWTSIVAFGVAAYAARRILVDGKPAETVTRTSRETQQMLKKLDREAREEATKKAEEDQAREEQKRRDEEAAKAKAELEAKERAAKAAEPEELDEAAVAAEAEAKAAVKRALAASKPAVGKPEPAAAADEADDDEEEAEDDDEAAAKPAEKSGGGKPGGGKPGGGKSGNKSKKNRKR